MQGPSGTQPDGHHPLGWGLAWGRILGSRERIGGGSLSALPGWTPGRNTGDEVARQRRHTATMAIPEQPIGAWQPHAETVGKTSRPEAKRLVTAAEQI